MLNYSILLAYFIIRLNCSGLVEKRQARWHGDKSARWTHRLISELTTWLDRKHGQVGFYLAQALSGHGCFNAYLKRFKKRDDDSCSYCRSFVENAEHTPAPGISGVENVTDVDRWPPWRWLFMRPTLYRLPIIEH